MKRMLLLLVALVGMSSCEFDHLYYQTSLKALIRIDVDWSATEFSPIGVSAYVYKENGDLYCSELSGDPSEVFLKLPAGSYTVVLHNNSMADLSGVELIGMKYLSTSGIYATENKNMPAFDVPSNAPGTEEDRVDESLLFINEPDDIASFTLRDVEVESSDIEYHYYKPNLSDYEQECYASYTAKPLHIIHKARVIVRIGGLDNAAGAPTAILSGMAGGYDFDNESASDKSVMEQFKVNSRVTKGDEDADKDDVIYADYDTFGMHTSDTNNSKYYLDMRFKLTDGSHKDYHVDVTNNIKTEKLEYRNRHIVDVSLERLPDVDDGGDPEGETEGTFDPSLDEWVDVNVDLVM